MEQCSDTQKQESTNDVAYHVDVKQLSALTARDLVRRIHLVERKVKFQHGSVLGTLIHLRPSAHPFAKLIIQTDAIRRSIAQTN